MSDTTFMKMNADRYIRMALEEDITSEDISTNCVMPEYQKGQVDLICKQDGVICGLWVFQRVFELLDDTVTFDMKVKEGDFVHAGDLMAVVTGDIRTLLSGERTALNYLQRMSGIATYTHEIAQLLEGSHTTLLDTRKTTPNMRLFEKYAVKVGGGSNHRYNLSDGVMLKDNHIGAAGSITKAVRMAKEYASFVHKIEVEVETLEQVKEACEAGADIIMLDNMTPDKMKEAVKLNTMILLNEKYGITEKDFARAEIEIVPAYKSRDVGFDRSMIGGYGHDDRVDAYPALMAEIATKNPAFTTVCVLTDKEEIGSDGVTGMQSMYVFHFMQELCRTAGQDDIIAFRNSVCLSADVTAAYDPSWASAFEPMNGTYAGRGIALFKYTGSRGKSAANDASAELVGYVTRMMDADDVAWQIGELGRLDLGGGGTIAKYVANRGIPVIDIGVPVLSMHSPFEVIHKTDLYMAYRAFVLFNQAAE